MHTSGHASERGLTLLSLETGSMAFFERARAVYERHGFVDCPPLGD